MFTLSGLRLALFLLTIFPETEKILSDGTDVAGMHNSCLASLESKGNLSAFFCHHSRAGSRTGSIIYSLSGLSQERVRQQVND